MTIAAQSSPCKKFQQKIQIHTRCCNKVTVSVYFKWSRVRKWPCCHALSRSISTTLSSRWPLYVRAPFRVIWCIPICVAARVSSPSVIPAKVYARCWSAPWGCRSFKNKSSSLRWLLPDSALGKLTNYAVLWRHGKNAVVLNSSRKNSSTA